VNKIVKKILVSYFFIFILSPCITFGSGKSDANYPVLEINNYTQTSMREQYTAGHWFAIPSDNKIIVIGISNPMLRREDEIAAAKEDAARKVAMYYGIQGSIETIQSTGANFFDYVNDSRINLKYDQDYIKYVDQLTYDSKHDILLTDEGLFIRFQHETNVENIGYIVSKSPEGRPSWTKNKDKPRFDGFWTAVGFAQNQQRLKETIFKATEAAAVRIIEDLYSSIINNEITGTEYSSSSLIYAKSEGKLNNFQIIEFWIDPEMGYVYTLAIAKMDE
jgi:hypothetical protein